MTSKERALLALARQVGDRVPIDYDANGGIDGRLKKHFGLAAGDGEGLRQRLGVDFRRVEPAYIGPKLHADLPGRLIDIWGTHMRWIEHASGGYWDYCDFPLQEATLEQVEAWPMPSPDDFNYEGLAHWCRSLQDSCIVLGGPGWGDVINSTGMIATMEQTLIDLACDEPALLRFIQRRAEVQLAVLERALAACQKLVDVVYVGEDLGTQIGPLISPALFRRHIRPVHERLIGLARGHGLPVMMHSCGSSSWAFDDFIEMGVSVVDTLQPEAANMAPAYLKGRYGNRLAFHGCISTAGAVASGTPADVIADVRQTLETMMPGGGYALAPTHQLQDNSPTQNVLAMYDAAQTYGRY